MSDSLRAIKLFVATYEERSFTTAAIRENATQSGVSQHIHKLEQGLGIQLFQRDRTGITPTPGADAFYHRCIDVLRAHEMANRVAKGYKKGLSGEISIGMMPSLTRQILGPTLARFVAAHPNAALRLSEGYSGYLTSRALSGAFDLAIVPAFAIPTGLDSRHFITAPEFLVSGVNSQLENLAPLRIADLKNVKLVLPGKGNTRRDTVEAYISSNGGSIQQILELDSIPGALGFIQRTDWVLFSSSIMFSGDECGTVFKFNPITEPPLVFDLVVINPRRRPISEIGEAFVEILQDEARLHLRNWPG